MNKLLTAALIVVLLLAFHVSARGAEWRVARELEVGRNRWWRRCGRLFDELVDYCIDHLCVERIFRSPVTERYLVFAGTFHELPHGAVGQWAATLRNEQIRRIRARRFSSFGSASWADCNAAFSAAGSVTGSQRERADPLWL